MFPLFATNEPLAGCLKWCWTSKWWWPPKHNLIEHSWKGRSSKALLVRWQEDSLVLLLWVANLDSAHTQLWMMVNDFESVGNKSCQKLSPFFIGYLNLICFLWLVWVRHIIEVIPNFVSNKLNVISIGDFAPRCSMNWPSGNQIPWMVGSLMVAITDMVVFITFPAFRAS